MSEPYSERCSYCGSPNVLDDAWFCSSRGCFEVYMAEMKAAAEYEGRQALSRNKGQRDLWLTKAMVWGHGVSAIERANDNLLAIVGETVPKGEGWAWRENRRNRQEFARLAEMQLTRGQL